MNNAETARRDIDTGVTLYQPYLEFHNPGWLKQTLLLWDAVRRIVPTDYQPDDNDEVREALDAKAVLNTAPEPYAEKAADRFLESWQPLRTEKLVDAIENAADRIPNGNMGAQVGLWHRKVSDKLARRLEKEGVLRQDGNWYRTDGIHAGLYMTCLATTMADAIGITCCTDRAFFQTNAKFFQRGASSAGPHNLSHEKWFSLGLKLPTAENVSSVPMKSILEFRTKHREARMNLRRILADVSASLSSCGDDNAVQDMIRAESARIQSQLDDYRERLSDLRVRATTTFFRIDRPAAAVAAASLIAAPDGLSKTLGVFAGFALGVADWWVDLRTEFRDLKRANPLHYLSLVQRKFGR